MQNETRKLTLQEHQTAVRLYNELAGIFTSESRGGDNPVLARNRWVELTIIECVEEVGDERTLVEAWRIWVKGRDVSGLSWPVTKFRAEMTGLLPAAGQEVEFRAAQERYAATRKAVR